MKPTIAVLEYKYSVTDNDNPAHSWHCVNFKLKFMRSDDWQYLKINTTSDYKTILGYSLDDCKVIGEAHPLWMTALLTASNQPQNIDEHGRPKQLVLKRAHNTWWYESDGTANVKMQELPLEILIKDKPEPSSLRHRFMTNPTSHVPKETLIYTKSFGKSK